MTNSNLSNSTVAHLIAFLTYIYAPLCCSFAGNRQVSFETCLFFFFTINYSFFTILLLTTASHRIAASNASLKNYRLSFRQSIHVNSPLFQEQGTVLFYAKNSCPAKQPGRSGYNIYQSSKLTRTLMFLFSLYAAFSMAVTSSSIGYWAVIMLRMGVRSFSTWSMTSLMVEGR